MLRSGFVLAGGASSRMGRDKALLAYRDATLVEHVARAVLEAVGSVAVIGDPERYGGMGYPVYPDQVPACGPLGGIYTALSVSATDWNMVVACDMPAISAQFLRVLIAEEAKPGHKSVMAMGPRGEPEPLCAIYHRDCLPALARALRDKRFKMRDLVGELQAELRPLQAAALTNINTPEEWAGFRQDTR